MNEGALYRLLSWLSPAFPIGAYCHSSGLEWAVNDGLVATRPTLIAWAEDMLAHGSGRTDAVQFTHAYRAAAEGDSTRLANLAELAAALHPSHERRLESTAQGAAFRRIAFAAAPCASLGLIAKVDDDMMAYPIVVAVLAAGHEIAL